jgi:protease-4
MRKWPWMMMLLMLLATLGGCSLFKFSLFPDAGPLKEVTLEGTGKDKVLLLTLNGVISDQPKQKLLHTRPGMVQELAVRLNKARKDDHIKALVLKVNSPGGPVTASDMIYHEISEYKKQSGVKVIVAMMDVAASGGYYLSLPADWIMAQPTTITGSIGVIFLRPGFSGFMEKYGFEMNVNKSGVNKDMGSPFREPTKQDNDIFQDLTDQMAERFHNLVQQHRNPTPRQMEEIKTARVFLGQQALKLGLVDEIGYLGDAVVKARNLAGLDENAGVVTYRRSKSEEDTLYTLDMSALQGGISADLRTLSRLLSIPDAGLYYVWPVAVGNE